MGLFFSSNILSASDALKTKTKTKYPYVKPKKKEKKKKTIFQPKSKTYPIINSQWDYTIFSSNVVSASDALKTKTK